jgi:hypothetical protein
MKRIDTLAALDAVGDTTLRPILERYRDMIELAEIFVIEPGDTLETLQASRGQPFEGHEFIHRHASGWLEGVWIICDDGSGHVVLAFDGPATDPTLRTRMMAEAVPADPP